MISRKNFGLLLFYTIAPLIFCLVVKLMLDHMAEQRKIDDTHRLVDVESGIIIKTHGKDYIPPEDVWGTTLQWHFEPNQKVHTATVVSAGPDKIFPTMDDIGKTRTDYNKTGIVAEWAGSKVKESVKGFIRGLKNPSNHEEPQFKEKE